MTIHYAYFCDDCGKHTNEAIEVCEWCCSKDITRAPIYASVDHDDAASEARMAEIRENWDQSMERGQRLLDEVAATQRAHAALDQLVEVARGNYEVPHINFRVKQAG